MVLGPLSVVPCPLFFARGSSSFGRAGPGATGEGQRTRDKGQGTATTPALRASALVPKPEFGYENREAIPSSPRSLSLFGLIRVDPRTPVRVRSPRGMRSPLQRFELVVGLD